MPEFAYEDLLPLGTDETAYRLLTTEGVRSVPGPGVGPFSRCSPRRCSC